MTYETRITKVTVVPKGEPLYHEGATEIKIVDDAAGEYLEVSQCSDHNEGKILIDSVEWPVLKKAINKMIKECCEEI
jgi:hypothetical protein